MVAEFFVDMYAARRALLMAILTHPLVKNTAVPYPNIGGAPREDISIKRGRLFGGPELVEAGLTLAVYPYHSAYDPVSPIPPDSVNTEKSVVYTPGSSREDRYTSLGNARGEFSYYSTWRFMVQLYYQDGVYDPQETIKAHTIDSTYNYTNDYYGYQFKYQDDRLPEDKKLIYNPSDVLEDTISIDVQVLPGEEILCQWLDIIKFALRDIKVLPPFNVLRNPCVMCADYPTSTWSTKPANLILHTAFLIVQFDCNEPERIPLVESPLIQDVNIT